MGKISFVFSGQGAQFAGMGKSILRELRKSAKSFSTKPKKHVRNDRAVLRWQRRRTQNDGNTQPCLYLASLAASYAMDDAGISADMTAGFSLGEIFVAWCLRARTPPKRAFASYAAAPNSWRRPLCRKIHVCMPYNSWGSFGAKSPESKLPQK